MSQRDLVLEEDRIHGGVHVDILGRSSLNDLILKVAAGKGDEIGESVVSDIKTYADRVKVYGGRGVLPICVG